MGGAVDTLKMRRLQAQAYIEVKCVYPDPKERLDVLAYLLTLPTEYHKEYKRFNQIVKVPRGQASLNAGSKRRSARDSVRASRPHAVHLRRGCSRVERVLLSFKTFSAFRL